MCDIKILGDHNSLIVHKGYKYRDDNNANGVYSISGLSKPL